MAIAETFAGWVRQLEAELTEATEARAVAKADVATAEAVLNAAIAERDDVRATLAATGRPTPVKFGRLMHPIEAAVFKAEGAVVRAKSIWTNAIRTVEDIEAGLAELRLLNAKPAPDAAEAEEIG